MDEVVTLIVDSYGGLDAKTKFIVHKSFVCHYSPAVKAVFENGPRYPRSHRFYNTSSNTAQLLVQWIYTQKVDSSKPKEEAAGELKTQSLVFVWALAERLQIPRLQNAVIRELQALRDRGEPVAMRRRKAHDSRLVGDVIGLGRGIHDKDAQGEAEQRTIGLAHQKKGKDHYRQSQPVDRSRP